MRVSEIMTNAAVLDQSDDTLAEAARKMWKQQTGSLLVTDGEDLIGIITERDLVRAIADGVNPSQTAASLIMTADPATVTADEDVSVVALKMMRLGVRHLPVVDGNGKPVGLVSARNLVAVLDRARS